MTKIVRRAAVSVFAVSALLLAGGAAFASDNGGEEASYTKCVDATAIVAGPDGAAVISFEEYIDSSSSNDGS